jgi:hypothetical protein
MEHGAKYISNTSNKTKVKNIFGENRNADRNIKAQ